METKTVEGIKLFKCSSAGAWISPMGCQAHVNAAERAIKEIQNGTPLWLIEVLEPNALQRLSECIRCHDFETLSQGEFDLQVWLEVAELMEEAEEVASSDIHQYNHDKTLAAKRRWKQKQKEKEIKNEERTVQD
jgi:hypothetical protein